MKSYKQYCGVARALDLVGNRWALLLVRELLLGPRRFTDLKLPGLTPTMLSTRLKELEEAGLVQAVSLPPPARQAWSLTDAGRRLEPVVLALGAFGAAYLGVPASDDAVRHRWLMVSLQRRYRGALDGGVAELWFDDVPYSVAFRGGRAVVRDGASAGADVVVRGTASAMIAALARGHASAVAITGDGSLWSALLDGLEGGQSPQELHPSR